MSNQNKPASAFGSPGSYPRMDVNRPSNPVAESVTGKMVAPQNVSGTAVRLNRELRAPDQALMQRISDQTTNNIVSTKSLLQILPDTELAMQIMVSSILSPKDMVSTELQYSVESGQFNNELSGALLECIRTHFDSTYKMGEQLPKILQDALFLTGSYPMVVLPENVIDEVINSPNRVAMESIRDQIEPGKNRLRAVGLLGNKPAENATPGAVDFLGLESLSTSLEQWNQGRAAYDPEVKAFAGVEDKSKTWDPMLSVTDNPNALKMPRLQEKMRTDRVQDVLAKQDLALETYKTPVFNQKNKPKSLYRNRRYRYQGVVALQPSSTLKKESVGHPLVMRMPSEAVIPVHVPSNPEEHLGYFVLLDQMGNPLVRANEADYYTNLSQNLNSQSSGMDALIAKTRRDTQGRDDPSMSRQMDVEEMERIYGDLVEAELKARLSTGVYGENVQVARPTEVYRIMMARALNKMRTQLLYIPAEMMVYVAFDYNQHGVGQSLLAKSKILAGLRAMMTFATSMAAMKNSVGRTNVNINLSEQDPDPSGTVEFLLHEHSKLRRGGFPLGNSDPNDLISYIQNAAVEVTVQGNSAYPETSVKVEDLQTNRAKPDQDLVDDLRKRHLMALGLSPETVDASYGAEFATSVVQNNLLLTKRVLMYQRALVVFIEEFIQKYTLSSQTLMDELRQIVKDNQSKLDAEDKETIDRAQDTADKQDAVQNGVPREQVIEERPLEDEHFASRRADDAAALDDTDDDGIDGLITEFIQAIRVALPAPDTATLENQMKAFDEYAEALEKALKVYMDAEFITSTELGELAQYLPAAIAATKAHYLRQWLRNNNVLPELNELVTFDDKEDPDLDLLETHEAHMEGLGKSLMSYLQRIAKVREKLDPKAKEVADTLGTPEASGGGMDAFGGGGDTFGSDTFGSDAGGDGLGGDLDTSGIDAIGTDTTDVTETSEETTDTTDSDTDADAADADPAADTASADDAAAEDDAK